MPYGCLLTKPLDIVLYLIYRSGMKPLAEFESQLWLVLTRFARALKVAFFAYVAFFLFMQGDI